MNLTVTSLIAQAISFWLWITVAIWYVGPWVRRQPVAIALSVPLWVHAFRHIALQMFSAQRFGFVLPDSLASEIAWGDVAGASLALLSLWLLRFRSPAALFLIWLFAVESAVDLTNAAIGGTRAGAAETAHDITWMILNFYVPMLWVSLALLVWQLVTRGRELLVPRAEPVGGLVSTPASPSSPTS